MNITMRKRCVCIVHVKSQSASTEQRRFPAAGWFDPMGATVALEMGEGKPLHRHAPFPVWPLSKNSPSREQSGSGALGRAPRKVNVWRLPSPPLWLRAFLARKAKSLASPTGDLVPPPVVLPDRRGPRGGLCRCGEPRSGPGPRMKICSRVSATRPARHRRPP